MGFEWATDDCGRRVRNKLIELGIPVKFSENQACGACKKPECNQKRSGTSKENVYLDTKDFNPNFTVEDNIRLRRERLKAAWAKEDEERIVRGMSE